MEIKMDKENKLQEFCPKSSIKQLSAINSDSFANLPPLVSKISSQGDKLQSGRSSGKVEESCENCVKNKVCINTKCIDSQQVVFCCEKCYKKYHGDHSKDYVIDISSIDSQIKKMHQEVIDGPLFRLATDLREMTKDFNDLKKGFPSSQEIPIVEFALHSKRINQINVRSKEQKDDYDRMRKESIKSAIRISKIERKNQKLKLHIDEIFIEQNTMDLLKKYEEMIHFQQQKLDEFKERIYKIFQDIRKVSGQISLNTFQYQSLSIGSKPLLPLDRDILLNQKPSNYISIDSQFDDQNFNPTNNSYSDSHNSYNNFNSGQNINNVFNNNNNPQFNNFNPQQNLQQQQNSLFINNCNSTLSTAQPSQQLLHQYINFQEQKINNISENNQMQNLNEFKGKQGMPQQTLFSNSMSNSRQYDSNKQGFFGDNQDNFGYNQKIEQNQGISQSFNSINNKTINKANNLFSENNNNNSMSCSNTNNDSLKSTPYKQQKTQKKINEYFFSTKDQRPQIKVEDKILKQIQNEKFIQQQQQQILFYEQQKQKQQQNIIQQNQLQQNSAQQQLQNQQQQLQYQHQQQQNQQQHQQQQQFQQQFQQQQQQHLQQQNQLKQQQQLQQQQLLFFNQQKQQNQKQLLEQQINQSKIEQQNILNVIMPKKNDTVFMKSDVQVIDELMKLTQSTIYTQYDEDVNNDLRKSPSQQSYIESQISFTSKPRYLSNQSMNEISQKQKIKTVPIKANESQQSNRGELKQKQPLHSIELYCSEQLSEPTEQSIGNQNKQQDKQNQKQPFQKEEYSKQKMIFTPSSSTLSSKIQDHGEQKASFLQTFGAIQQQQQLRQQDQEDQLSSKASQDLYCWETLSNTQKQDKNK